MVAKHLYEIQLGNFTEWEKFSYFADGAFKLTNLLKLSATLMVPALLCG